ncbi:aldo/keto reductase [Kineococcus sp. SYSU DK004]|uniref:aldo/keto reductase n=1 Tax=Kineococcus sp. SYSU DK004 TaxID=3383125 RepID=UPI003D7CAD4D
MSVPVLDLPTGRPIPQLGLGTARTDDATARRVVAQAIELGYRLVDTAARYENEVGVGQGIADAGLPREELYVTTKLRGADQGYAPTRTALRASLERLGLDHVDLYLVHWPLPRLGLFAESYRAMVEMREEGLTRAVGVSNFLPEHLDVLHAEGLPVPAVNQVEFHPRLQQRGVLDDNARRGIVTQAWSPLGAGKGLLEEEPVRAAAQRHGVSPAQVVLRWDVQHGVVTIPKASSRERLAQNLDVFSFSLDDAEVAAIDALERGERVGGQDPALHEEF